MLKVDQVYEMTWYQKADSPFAISTQCRTFRGNGQEIAGMIRYLDTSDMIIEDVEIAEIKPLDPDLIGKHWHRINGEIQEHPWEECWENPESPNYNNGGDPDDL